MQAKESAVLEKLEEKLKYFEEKFELADKTTETFSSFVGDACSSINDLVVEFNDEIGNITIENEDDNQLSSTFEKPYKWKYNIAKLILNFNFNLVER